MDLNLDDWHRLRGILAARYPDEEDQRRIAFDSGLNPAMVKISGKAISSWQSILSIAQGQAGIFERLVSLASREFPGDQELAAFKAASSDGAKTKPAGQKHFEIVLAHVQEVVRAPRSIEEISQLDELQSKYWLDGNKSAFYVTLTLSFLFFRFPKESGIQNFIDQIYNRTKHYLRRLAEWEYPESMAARWILARLELEAASKLTGSINDEDATRRRINLTKRSISLFLGIIPTEIQYPIFLPGARQEYPESKVQSIYGTDDDVEPLLQEIIQPHRYISATDVMLSYLLKEPAFLNESNFHLGELRKKQPYAIASLINADIVSLNSRLIARSCFRSDEPAVQLGGEIEGKIKEVVAETHNGLILPHKANEWIANLYACLAVATSKGREHDDAIAAMCNALKNSSPPGSPPRSFLTTDPIYQCAIDQSEPGGFQEFVRDFKAT